MQIFVRETRTKSFSPCIVSEKGLSGGLQVEIAAGPAFKKDLSLAQFNRISPGGGTALYDALTTALPMAVEIHRKIDAQISVNCIYISCYLI